MSSSASEPELPAGDADSPVAPNPVVRQQESSTNRRGFSADSFETPPPRRRSLMTAGGMKAKTSTAAPVPRTSSISTIVSIDLTGSSDDEAPAAIKRLRDGDDEASPIHRRARVGNKSLTGTNSSMERAALTPAGASSVNGRPRLHHDADVEEIKREPVSPFSLAPASTASSLD
jgi:hypothetical protein